LDGFAAPYCACYDGWTSSDCSIPTGNFKRLPYGEHFGPKDEDDANKKNSGYWQKRDRYKDHHPVFQLDEIATINIQISDENFQMLLDPRNKWTDIFLNCSVLFDNAHNLRLPETMSTEEPTYSSHDRGHITRIIRDVGIRLKGSATREYLKKSFKLKFNTIPQDFVDDGLPKPHEDAPERKRRFYELKKLGLKGPFHDDSFIKNQLMSEFYRAWVIPTMRASFASVSINGLHWGLYWIHEPMDDLFLESHYEDPSGNYYKAGCGGSYMSYLGEDPNLYKNATKQWRDTVRPYVFQNRGNGDWSDLARLIHIIHKTENSSFQATISQVLDVEKFLRHLVIETAVCNTDDYTRNGNNWRLYHNPKTNLFEIHGFDWDITFRDTECSIWGGSRRAQLTHRILQVPEFRERYLELMHKFMHHIWRSDTLKERVATWRDFVLNEVRKDYNYRLDFTRSELDMLQDANYILHTFIPKRYESVKRQLEDAGYIMADHSKEDRNARHSLHVSIIYTILIAGGVCILALLYLGYMLKNYTKVKAKEILHGHHHREHINYKTFTL